MLYLVIIILALIFLLHYGGLDAPFVGVEAQAIKQALDLADVDENDVVYDLGSGDGRVVIASAMRGARAYGIEISRIRVWYSRILIRILRLQDKATIIHGNIFREDLSNATVVISFLLEETHVRLKYKLEKDLPNGAKVVAIAFKYPGWKETEVDLKGTQYGPLRLYTMPPEKREYYV